MALEAEEAEIAERLADADGVWEELERRSRYDYQVAYAKIKLAERRRRYRRMGVAVGAAASLLIASLVLVYQSRGPAEEPVLAAGATIKPGEQKAILTTSDGQTRLLGEEEVSLKEGNGVELMVGTGGIHYRKNDMLPRDTAVLYNILEVPRGGVYPTILADGTRVWLNSETTLRYPVVFAGDQRVVELNGEAYFDVVTDAGKPFIVRMKSGDITVLGTRFNVKSYPDERSLVATLVEGSVRFGNTHTPGITLRPGHQLQYDKETHTAKVKPVKTALYTSWKDNLFEFEGESLENIMRVLARWYDLEVVFENEPLKALNFTGNLDKYKDIETFFRLFEAGADVRFIIKNKAIIIREK